MSKPPRKKCLRNINAIWDKTKNAGIDTRAHLIGGLGPKQIRCQ